MTDRHPLYNAVCLWASDPEVWVWQWLDGGEWLEISRPPSRRDIEAFKFRCVHRDWLRDPESVCISSRLRTAAPDSAWYDVIHERLWDHETHEYRVEPRKRTGRMVEAPEVGDTVFLAAPGSRDWHDKYIWVGDEFDLMWLERGLCYHDADSAIAAARRMAYIAQLDIKGDDL